MNRAPGSRAISAAEVAERLRAEGRVVAVAHEAPDGDALGCLSAFVLICEGLGVPCKAYIPGVSGFPGEYLFLPRVDGILRGDPPTTDPDTTLYFFDCASLIRSNSHGFPEGVTRVNIDHHQDNPGYGEFNLLAPAAPSTTAILYEICKAGGFSVDADVAAGLYVGLVTDTGRFQYSNTTPAAHRMAAELQERGVDVNAVYRRVYESTPLPKLVLLQRTLARLEVRLGGALVISWLENADFALAGADEGHAEGLIDTLRQVKGARVAALLRERVSTGRVETKVSLRSVDGGVDVAALAAKRGGGGHTRASGFTTAEDVATVMAWIENQVAAVL